MVESVDTRDSKSPGQEWLCGVKSRFEYQFQIIQKTDKMQADSDEPACILSINILASATA